MFPLEVKVKLLNFIPSVLYSIFDGEKFQITRLSIFLWIVKYKNIDDNMLSLTSFHCIFFLTSKNAQRNMVLDETQNSIASLMTVNKSSSPKKALLVLAFYEPEQLDIDSQ